MSKKNVIFVITNNLKGPVRDSYHHFWGLGDIIRGVITVHLLSKKFNFNFFVDIQLHPISNYLKETYNPFKEYVYKNRESIHFINNSESYIKSFIDSDSSEPLLIFTNNSFDTNEVICNEQPYEDYLKLPSETKEFIKNILIPNEEFENYINLKKEEKNISNYNSIHIRLGDNEMVRQNPYKIGDDLIANILESSERNKIYFNLPSIIFSDSLSLKNKIKELNIPDIIVFDTDIKHIGYHDDCKDSLFEFIMVTRSSIISAINIYKCISGFIRTSRDIYDVKIIHKVISISQ